MCVMFDMILDVLMMKGLIPKNFHIDQMRSSTITIQLYHTSMGYVGLSYHTYPITEPLKIPRFPISLYFFWLIAVPLVGDHNPQ